jgi:hypothetical protein
MEGAVDSSRTYGKSIDPDPNGRLEVKTPVGSGLKVTDRGIEVDGGVGDENLDSMNPVDDVAAAATAADLGAALNALLKALRDTKRMRII